MTALLGGMAQVFIPGHLVAVVAAALLTAQADLWRTLWLLAAFAGGLASGLGAVALGVGETPAGDALLVAAALGGLAAALAVAVPASLAATLTFVIGLGIGLDSPPDAIAIRDAVVGLIGTACAGVALFAAASAAVALLARPWQGIPVRVAGSWIAAIAILVLALRWAA